MFQLFRMQQSNRVWHYYYLHGLLSKGWYWHPDDNCLIESFNVMVDNLLIKVLYVSHVLWWLLVWVPYSTSFIDHFFIAITTSYMFSSYIHMAVVCTILHDYYIEISQQKSVRMWDQPQLRYHPSSIRTQEKW